MSLYDPLQLPLLNSLLLLNDPSVYSFFFPTLPTSTLDVLHASVIRPNLFCGSFTLETHGIIQSKTPSQSSQLHDRMLSVFAPAFSTDSGLILGFEIIRCKSKTPNPFFNHPLYTAKIVRDDKRGFALSITEDHDGYTEIGCLMKLTERCRAFISIIVNTRSFQNLLSSRSVDAFSIHQLQKLILCCVHSIDMEQCVICPASADCTCKYDFGDVPCESTEQKKQLAVVEKYMGSNTGVAAINVYNKGQCVQSTAFDASVRCTFFIDHVFEKEMTIWAIRNAVERQNINLIKLAMPAQSPSFTTWEQIDHVLADFPVAHTSVNPITQPASNTLAIEFEPDHCTSPSEANTVTNSSSNPSSTRSSADSIQNACKPSNIHPEPVVAASLSALPRLAPATTYTPRPECSVTVERQKRVEERKFRNRLSAQRSNEKRRLELIKLKKNIEDAAKRKAHLRELERALREENLALKSALLATVVDSRELT